MPLEHARGHTIDDRRVGDVARFLLVGGEACAPGKPDDAPAPRAQLAGEGLSDPGGGAGDDCDAHTRGDGSLARVFEGKRGLVLGVANRRSIAWAIAKRLADGGAQLAFTYQGERIEGNVRELAESVSSPLVTSCDVRSDEDIARVFGEVSDTFGGQLDLLVHSFAFAAAGDLDGRFTDTPRCRSSME